MAHRYFEGKVHAMIYSKYRPVPPTALIERMVSFLKQKYKGELNLAYDVGCGSGQSTDLLAPYFQKVIGTDISPSQIEQAIEKNKVPNVAFQVCAAETIPQPDNSVQLITVSQAAHWFDLPKFYEEGKRVLSPGGIMCIYGYQLPRLRWDEDPTKNKALDEAIDELYGVDLNGYWAAERKFVDNKYDNFVIPYNGFTRDETFYHEMTSTVSNVVMYCHSWSGYQNFVKKNGETEGLKIIDKFQQRVMSTLNVPTAPEETKITKRTNYFLLMARK